MAARINLEAQILNNEKLVSALTARSGCTACLPLLTCCCGSCGPQSKPVFIDTRGHFGQIVPNFGMVHTACIREHGVTHICTRLPLCDLCHARRKLAAAEEEEPSAREKAVAESIDEYVARGIEFKAAAAVHKDDADGFNVPDFATPNPVEPSAKRFQSNEAPPPRFAMPGMTMSAAPSPAPSFSSAAAPANAFSGMKLVAAPAKVAYPIATTAKPQSGQGMTITAKFNSKCAAGANCKVMLQIEAGAKVVWVKPLGVFHPECHQA